VDLVSDKARHSSLGIVMLDRMEYNQLAHVFARRTAGVDDAAAIGPSQLPFRPSIYLRF